MNLKYKFAITFMRVCVYMHTCVYISVCTWSSCVCECALNASIELSELAYWIANSFAHLSAPPLKVWLQGILSPLIADRSYRFSCGVAGAYPSPSVKWRITRRGKAAPENLGKEVSPTGTYFVFRCVCLLTCEKAK